jgi:hypothetical protein
LFFDFKLIIVGPNDSEEMVMGAAVKAPKYLREKGYKCPTDPSDGFMQYAFQTKMSSFDLFHSIPWVFKDFNAWSVLVLHLLPPYVHDMLTVVTVSINIKSNPDRKTTDMR